MAEHNAFGWEGEQIAKDFLIKKGYRILKQNYRFDRAEIDIIAQKENIVCIVEVKSRKSGFLGSIEDSIGKGKIKRLVKAADYFVQQNELDLEVRFDVITVFKSEKGHVIDHIEDAFNIF